MSGMERGLSEMASAYLHDVLLDTAQGNVTLLLSFGVAAALAVTGLSFLWWRSAEFARARKHLNRGSKKHLPAPPAVLPRWCGSLGGHTLALDTSKISEQFDGWAKDFGGDYELHLFGKRLVAVCGLADIRRILNLRPSKFGRGLTPTDYKFSGGSAGLAPSMFFMEDKEWGRSRRLISPTLLGHNLLAMLPLISKIGERMCTKLGTQADSGEVIDALEIFERFTHDVIALAAFGLDVNSIEATKENPCVSYEAISSATATLSELTIKPMSIIGWKFMSSMLPWVRHAKAHSARLSKVVQDSINAIRRDAQQTKAKGGGDAAPETTLSGGSVLRKIVRTDRAGDASDRTFFSDKEAHLELTALFVAGTETSALTMSWTMYYLAKNPKVYARCRAEALSVAQSSNGMMSTREELSKLVFCAAVFREALRLKPPAAFLFLHNTEDYTMKSGVVCEKGTTFALLTRAVSISEECFTRGTEFIPERWIEAERDDALLGKGARAEKRSAVHVEEGFLSFGGGPRLCPGKDMANAEGPAVVASICARFSISLAPEQVDPPEETDSFTCGPKTLKILLHRNTD